MAWPNSDISRGRRVQDVPAVSGFLHWHHVLQGCASSRRRCFPPFCGCILLHGMVSIRSRADGHLNLFTSWVWCPKCLFLLTDIKIIFHVSPKAFCRHQQQGGPHSGNHGAQHEPRNMLAFVCPRWATSCPSAGTYPVRDRPWHSASLAVASGRGKAGETSH